MPWRFVRDLRLHEVIQATLIRQTTKGNEEIEKKKKISQKPLELGTNLYVCLCACVCVCVCVCVVYSCVLLCVDM